MHLMRYFMLKVPFCVLVLIFASLHIFASDTSGATLLWDPNKEEDLAGYKLYYIASSGENGRIDVGNVTEYELSFLMEGKDYYLSLTAYDTSGNESNLSMLIYYPADDSDSDGDGIFDSVDNCREVPNPDQEDTIPLGGNNCGDACECEGNFDFDNDVDGNDLFKYAQDYGRVDCVDADPPCYGDFNCNGNVDGSDLHRFVSDYGRWSGGDRPCPYCPTDPWCVYP